MTRAKFLFVSVLLFFVSALGLEKRSRKWLEENGFIIEKAECARPGMVRVCIFLGPVGSGIDGSGAASIGGHPEFPFCYSYLRTVMKRNNFMLVRKHERWDDISMKTTELAPPTVYRFERPWWI